MIETQAARDYSQLDYYSDESLVDDPHAYFRGLREIGPVTHVAHRNVVAVTGYDEMVEISLDNVHFSAVNGVSGPIPPLPFEPAGDDIAEQVIAERGNIPFSDQVVTQDGDRHLQLRSIIQPLFTPSRMKALEGRLRETADSLIDDFAVTGKVELTSQYGGPYATLVIADLLGLPDKDRIRFRQWLAGAVPARMNDPSDQTNGGFIKLGKRIFSLLGQRRLYATPGIRHVRELLGLNRRDPSGRDQILTEIAMARFPDGSKPTLVDITSLGAFLFGAGQDTTNRLLVNGMRVIAENPELQQKLRDEPDRIPDFIEEVLRYEGAVKAMARLCIRTTTVGGVEIKAGTTVLLSPLAANRDPRRFADPARFDMDRKKNKEHLAFGRGPHTCIGAQLARREVAVSFGRLLDRMGNIRISEAHHGPPGDRHFPYEPSYILRAMKALHLEFDPR